MLLPDSRWLNRSVTWKTIIAVLAVAGIVVALFIAAGGVSVSADEADGWVARNLLHFVFKRSIGSRSASVIPPDDLAAPSRVRIGAQHYAMVCANCHGGPGIGQSVVALSMSPRPQNLPKVVGQFTDAELYLIVAHGVKFSAMPSWATDTRDDEVWSMVSFLRQLPKLDANTYREMTALPVKADGAPPTGAADAALRPADSQRNTPPVDEFLYAAPTTGFGDVTIHSNPVATCARCHGADGSGQATGGEAPNLTIHDAAYLRASLEAYSDGKRKSGFMQPIAAQLSTQQIVALANYYAGLPAQSTPGRAADPALAKRGEQIATQGIREKAIPACANCHESTGSAITGAPHIAGQAATYLRRQLGAMRLGGRGSMRHWNPMAAEAHDLGDNDIAALAAYYSGQKPAKTGGAQLASLTIPQEDFGAAKEIFDTRCVKCHANDGRGDPQGGFPNVTIHSAPYAAQSLYAFRARTRQSNQMLEVTEQLSYDEMAALANYVGTLKPQPAVVKPDAEAAKRGAAIAEHGLADRGLPSCLSCHDAKGTAALALIPHLQGQSATYLRNKLDDFAGPIGANMSALNPMPAMASQLTDRERSDLAAYFAAAAPLEKPQPAR
jgi:cytochrome c553